MRLTVQRMNDDLRSNQGPSAVTSIMKNAQVRVNQDRAELLIEIMGTQGLGWEGANYTQNEIDHARNWLSGKAQSIYGGSNEIQSNIIAKRILGLLDHQ
jgi:alkylation response protein AidB-like acyl-CoA dehydrogenase